MNDDYRDVLRHVTPSDVRALRRSYRTAQAAASGLAAALVAAEVDPADAGVVGDGRPFVVVTLTRAAVAQILAQHRPAGWAADHRTEAA